MANKVLKSVRCHRPACRYEWTPKVPHPKKCPHCQNPLRRDKPAKARK